MQATFNDGSTAVIADYTSTPSVIAADTTKITVTKNGKSATIPIAVSEKAVTSIAVTTQPTKTSYIDGQKFDKSGMVVKAVYSDGSEKTITDYYVDEAELAVGTTTVYVTYNDFYATVPVSVAENGIKSIEITQSPDTTNYVEGQKFNANGMVVTATYADGSKADLPSTSYSYNTNALTTSDTEITVTAGDLTAAVPITVVAKAITGIEVIKNPNKMSYVEVSRLI